MKKIINEDSLKKNKEKSFYLNRMIYTLNSIIFRINYLRKLNQRDNKELWFAIYDSILVQIRAFLCESERNNNNYTMQTTLKKYGYDKKVKEVNNYLESPLKGDWFKSGNNSGTPKVITIRDGLKFVTDKFVCHFDPCYDDYEFMAREKNIQDTFTNFENDSVNNFSKIFSTILGILKKS